MSKPRLELRIVVYREGEHWLAHCLELEIVAEGDSPSASLKDVLELCATQLSFAAEEGNIDSIFRPAPPEFWALYARGKDVATESTACAPAIWPTSFDVDHVAVRELELCSS